MSCGRAWVWLLLLAVALVLRAPQLGVRPLHNDEAVNASKLATLWESGIYRYDPDEYHGPTLHYLSLPFLWLSPAKTQADLTDSELRWVTVACGTALVLLLMFLTDGLGFAACIWAGLFLAVSPAQVFYSRYFIHEMPLVFFTLLTLVSAWRYLRSPHPGWALLAGCGLGLMGATKETFVLSLAAAGPALLVCRFWDDRSPALAGGKASSEGIVGVHVWGGRFLRHGALALVAAFVVAEIFFTSFGTNPGGLLDSFKTFRPWFHRAAGASPHLHSWGFYLERLIWFHPVRGTLRSEALILVLAVGGCVASFSNRRVWGFHPGLARFLAVHTLCLTALYSFISYKTTWCLLNFWLGMILLAGLGAASLMRLCRTRWLRVLLFFGMVLGAGHLAWQARMVSVEQCANPRNPYVYSQTAQGCRELVEQVEAITRFSNAGHDTVVKVVSPDSYWPLPWYMRAYKQVGWWEQLPQDPYAPIVLVSTRLGAALDEKSNKAWLMTGLYELRGGVFMELYVERGLWNKFVADNSRLRAD